ncbi:NIPSNAP domain-containing protein [Mycolicibacterium litorale]|uniref:NIPSNAP domain-containing protein n=1 Tax=Mycolicibacterium litorale TaxID=758802 RepID=A0AAD1INE4_9MYCO|nr:NIPSNAP domain-containing protein [Mycolicibacterium litorale]MCV7417415.1 NIPSNAP domain-containing protein [Mycolicibacterium litorale]TDY05204.1 hypothetical protein BCL50_3992 [Mycolicibacterium litorale]BBY18639.1 hypothetical protein MLIT_42310 [Mycolicibacterium litorale]
MVELHTYTLASAEALRQYTTHFWPRHIESLRKHGITVQGVWIDGAPDGHRVVALVEYPPGANPARLADIYRHSVDFTEDHADFDMSLITSTHTVRLQSIPSSPLQ